MVVVDEDEKPARKGKSKVDPLVLVSIHLTPRTKTKPGARASTTRTNPKAVVFGPTGIPRSVFDNLNRAGLKSLIFDITAIATSDLSLRESDVMYKYATDSKATLQDTDAIQTLSAVMASSRATKALIIYVQQTDKVRGLVPLERLLTLRAVALPQADAPFGERGRGQGEAHRRSVEGAQGHR